jgi:hypothetical protein
MLMTWFRRFLFEHLYPIWMWLEAGFWYRLVRFLLLIVVAGVGFAVIDRFARRCRPVLFPCLQFGILLFQLRLMDQVLLDLLYCFQSIHYEQYHNDENTYFSAGECHRVGLQDQ